jgi:MFS family permease
MSSVHENSFSYKRFLCIVIPLIIIIIIDISIVKVYDLVDKDFVNEQTKILIFSINSLVGLVLQFIIILYLQRVFKNQRLNKHINIRLLSKISLISLSVIGIWMGLLIFQQFYNNYYQSLITIVITVISYGTASGLIIRLSISFLHWYNSNHNRIVFLYFISMVFISFNLIMTSAVAIAKITDNPEEIRRYVGGTADLSGYKYQLLDNIYKISSIIAFVSIWITTALIINKYREKTIVNFIIYWIILSLPLLYFLTSYTFQSLLFDIFITNLRVDPVSVTIVVTAFLSLSKPIGGLTFAVAFWNISKTLRYEKNIRAYMLISGWGILLLFGTNQAFLQIFSPYPPFGLVTITVLITAVFLLLLGIYNSTTLVSVNDNLRKQIHKHASELKFLGEMGRSEKESEVKAIVKKINQHMDRSRHPDVSVELDENELKKYIDLVVSETKNNIEK